VISDYARPHPPPSAPLTAPAMSPQGCHVLYMVSCSWGLRAIALSAETKDGRVQSRSFAISAAGVTSMSRADAP
jgi:hypothetical protein